MLRKRFLLSLALVAALGGPVSSEQTLPLPYSPMPMGQALNAILEEMVALRVELAAQQEIIRDLQGEVTLLRDLSDLPPTTPNFSASSMNGPPDQKGN